MKTTIDKNYDGKHLSFLSYMFLLVFVVSLSGCDWFKPDTNDSHGSARVTIRLTSVAASGNLIQPQQSGAEDLPGDITNVIVTCTAPDIATISGELLLDGTPLVMEIPEGTNRLFTADAYAAAILRMSGSTNLERLVAGAQESVVISLNDQARIILEPASATVQVGLTQQFNATVTNHADTSVSWSVNGSAGGDATVGTINNSGLYTAPLTVPTPDAVSIRATSNADTTLFAESLVTITTAPAITVSVAPLSASLTPGGTQTFIATVVNATNTAVTWSVQDVDCGAELGSVDVSGNYTAGNPASSCQVLVRATSVEEPSASAVATVTITPAITVTVSPPSATMSVNTSQQFTATVSGSSNTSVTWYVNDVQGGNSTLGIINSNGLYQAPAVVPSPDTVTIRAVSVADPASIGTASVTIVQPSSEAWAKTYGGTSSEFGRAFSSTSDGGFIITGNRFDSGNGDYDIWVIKTDSAGEIQWQRSYGVAGDDIPWAVQQTSDGGYVVAGRTTVATNINAFVIKLDTVGSITWQKSYGSDNAVYAYAIQQTPDNGFIVAGTLSEPLNAGDGLWVAKLDSNGDVSWENYYGGPSGTANVMQGWQVKQTSDGGYIAIGSVQNPSIPGQYQDLWIVKIAADGSLAWHRAYGGDNEDHGKVIHQTGDGGFIVAGDTSTYGAGGLDAWLLKLDVNGSIQWQKTYGTPGVDEEVQDMQPTQDGGYIVTANYNSNVGWAFKVDSSGNLLWHNALSGTAQAVQALSDGGYAVFGYMDVAGNSSDMQVHRLNALGDVGSPCGGGQLPQLSSSDSSTAPSEWFTASATSVGVTAADTAFTTTDTSAIAVGQCAVPSPSVSISPNVVDVPALSSQQFTATTAGSIHQEVTWSVNDITGGDATVGFISTDGLYSAPATVPTPDVVTVRAHNVAYPQAIGTATVTITPVSPLILLSSSSAAEPADGTNDEFSGSGDGRYAVFSSDAVNLVANDNNFATDIFLKDTQTGTTVRLSVDTNGVEANGASGEASISADGRYVVFSSFASNLVPNDTNDAQDVFRVDIQSGIISRVSLDVTGNEGESFANSRKPKISADGRYVVFESFANTLVAGDTNTASADVFRKDTQTGDISRISLDGAGNDLGSDGCVDYALSGEGRYVTCVTRGAFGTGDTNGVYDIYLIDAVAARITRRVSVNDVGVGFTEGGRGSAISSDGRYVAFYTAQQGAVADKTTQNTDLFLKDLQTEALTRLSVSIEGHQSNDSISINFNPGMSSDARYTVFVSPATNLITNDQQPTNDASSVFVKDAQTGAIRRIDVQTTLFDTAPGDAIFGAQSAKLSANGAYITFTYGYERPLGGSFYHVFRANNPLFGDDDGDGLLDVEETTTYLTSPTLADTDNDGLRDGDEVNFYFTEPLVADSDNDCYRDGDEIALASNPWDDVDIPSFYLAPSVYYAVTNVPVGIASGDLSADGYSDIAVVNRNARTVSVLLNNGSGSFNAAVDYGVYGSGSGPMALVIAQLDANASLDLAVVNMGQYPSAGAVSILLNNGDGTFATAVNYSVGQLPSSIAGGDFDNDGDFDLVTVNGFSDNVSLLLNNGDGTFATGTSPLSATSLTAVTAADFDGDNIADLAVIGAADLDGDLNAGETAVYVLISNGDGTFASAVTFAGAYTQSPYVVSGDVDNDTNIDLVLSQYDTNRISILLNDGSGDFSNLSEEQAGEQPSGLAIADLDGDGFPEIVITNDIHHEVAVLKNSNSGFRDLITFDTGYGPLRLTTSDLDNDGDQDIAVSNFYADSVSVLLNTDVTTLCQ